MSLNFPNTPSENDTYLDDNGRLWLFKNGYWQETIPIFSIDLLRDVHTIIDTQSITFVDSSGFESSIDANQDFPFILDDNSVNNIPFTPYALPFYISDGTYDGVDIVKYSPAINSMMYWNGTNWFPQIVTYTTSDLIGFNLNDSAVNDVMVWNTTTSEFDAEQKDLHVQYENSYNIGYLAEIETDGWMILNSTTDYAVLHKQEYGLTINSSDVNMIDLANNRLVCTSAGIYKIAWFWKVEHHTLSNATKFGFSTISTVYNSVGTIKYENKIGENVVGVSKNYELPQFDSRSIIDTVNLDVGDYVEFQIIKKRIIYDGAHTTYHYGRLSMFKIGDLAEATKFVRIVNVDGKNHTIASPLSISVDAGTYEIRPKKRDYTAVNPWSLVDGCTGAGDNCSKGWGWFLRYTSPSLGTDQLFAGGNGYQSTADQALNEVLLKSYDTFTISYTQNMTFWFHDTGYTDNIGGMSFELWKIV